MRRMGGWVKVEKVRKVRNRIVIGCKTEQERRKVKDRLEAVDEGLIVKVKNKNPLLILRFVLKVHDE